MSFQNIDQVKLGQYLQIAFEKGVTAQNSAASEEYDILNLRRTKNTQARECRFLINKDFGPAAVQNRNPGQKKRSLPKGSASTQTEGLMKFKETEIAVCVPYNVYERAMNSPEKYGDLMADEFARKAIAGRRHVSKEFHGDGTGVYGQVQSVIDEATVGATGRVTIDIKKPEGPFTVKGAGPVDPTIRGFIGWIEVGDIFKAADLTGNLVTPAGAPANFYGWKVESTVRENCCVTLVAVDDCEDTITGLAASDLAEDLVLYRVGQDCLPDLVALDAAPADFDWSCLTEALTGFGSLVADDSRKVHGITHSGTCAGTRLNAADSPASGSIFQKALSQAKTRVGQGVYSYDLALVAPEQLDILINSEDQNRRFHSVQDGERGLRYWSYQHNGDTVRTEASEFIPWDKIRMMPTSKRDGNKALSLYGTEYKAYKMPGGSIFHFNPADGGGLTNEVVSFLGTAHELCTHHAASLIEIYNLQSPV